MGFKVYNLETELFFLLIILSFVFSNQEFTFLQDLPNRTVNSFENTDNSFQYLSDNL